LKLINLHKKKIFLLVYITIVVSFLIIASYFNIDLEKFSTLIENNKNEIINLNNLLFFKITIFFILFSIIWTFFLGIGLPLLLFASFFYDIFLGTLILVSSRTIGSSIMYIIFKNFFSKEIKNYLNKKKLVNKKLMTFISRNQFKFFFSIRLIPGIPYQIPDLLPVIFNIKIFTFISAKFLGSLISNFIIINIFSNVYQKLNIKHLENVSNNDLNLFISIVMFFLLLLVGFYFKGKYFKN
tara:strand:+ start:392 stop:1111 length:720 start_codon:yes stop_codon:yes gene_type:complete